MGWIEDAALIAALNQNQRAKAIRDQRGRAMCSACRNHVHERARKCEHCGSTLYTRRGRLAGALFAGVGGGLGLLSLFALLFVPFAFNEGFVAGIVATMFAVPVTVCAVLAIYLARDLKKSQPVWTLRLRDRLPL